MNRFDIINKIGDKYRIGNTESGEFSYVQALKSVGKDIRDYQKATTGTQHQYLDIRFENDRLVILVETKNNRVPFGYFYQRTIRGYTIHDYIQEFARNNIW